MCILMVLPLILGKALREPKYLLSDADLWWHVADARQLVNTGHFIRTEPYSFTVAGERWVNPEWLSEIPYWVGYNTLGLRGIYLIAWLALAVNILLIYQRCRLRTENMSASFWSCSIAFMLMTLNAGARMIVIAYLAMSIELAILETIERGRRRWLVWLLPALFCVWINLHGSWVIGIGFFALYILCGAFTLQRGGFDQQARPIMETKRLVYAFGLSLLSLMVNPYGWRLCWNPFDMMLNQKLNIALVEEWQPLNLAWGAGKCALLVIGIVVVMNLLSPHKWKVYDLACLFFAWYAAFAHARFTFLAAIVTTPLLAREIARSICRKESAKTIPAINMLVVVATLWMIFRAIPGEASLNQSMSASFPRHLIAEIKPEWRTFNCMPIGGMLAFSGKPSFMDSRIDTFEHHGVLKEYLEALYVVRPIEVLDGARVDHALLVERTPLAYLLEHVPGWRVEGREGSGDDTFVLLGRDEKGQGKISSNNSQH